MSRRCYSIRHGHLMRECLRSLMSYEILVEAHFFQKAMVVNSLRKLFSYFYYGPILWVYGLVMVNFERMVVKNVVIYQILLVVKSYEDFCTILTDSTDSYCRLN